MSPWTRGSCGLSFGVEMYAGKMNQLNQRDAAENPQEQNYFMALPIRNGYIVRRRYTVKGKEVVEDDISVTCGKEVVEGGNH